MERTRLPVACLALTTLALLGCGARTELADSVGCFEDACDKPRTDDCARATPAATPLVTVSVGAPYYRLFDGAMYYRVENRIWRLRLDGDGAAEPLTPPAPSGSLGFDVRNGTLIWSNSDDLVVRAMPASGGAARTVATFPEPGDLLIAGDRVVSVVGVGRGDPNNVYSVPLAGGTPAIIASTTTFSVALDERDDHVLIGAETKTLSVDPVTGASVDLLRGVDPAFPETSWGAQNLGSTSDAMVAVAFAKFRMPGLALDAIYLFDGGPEPTELVRGIFGGVDVDATDVVFDGIVSETPPNPGHLRIGVVPRAGGEPVYLAESQTTYDDPAPLTGWFDSVKTDGTWVYWPERCSDREETRIVRMAKP